MEIFIKFDFESVKQFDERLKVISKDLRDRFFRDALNGLGNETRDEAVSRTPVVTNHLRNSWGITTVEKKSDAWFIEVINPVEYALYVEEGHRQEVGRYVKALGKRLVKPFVEGQHMLKGTLEEKIAPCAEEFLSAKLKELFGV